MSNRYRTELINDKIRWIVWNPMDFYVSETYCATSNFFINISNSVIF